MSVYEHLPKQMPPALKQVGWTKAAELVKVARSDGHEFDSATWLHRPRSMPREEFQREVDRHLTADKSLGYWLEMICADFLAEPSVRRVVPPIGEHQAMLPL